MEVKWKLGAAAGCWIQPAGSRKSEPWTADVCLKMPGCGCYYNSQKARHFGTSQISSSFFSFFHLVAVTFISFKKAFILHVEEIPLCCAVKKKNPKTINSAKQQKCDCAISLSPWFHHHKQADCIYVLRIYSRECWIIILLLACKIQR